MSLRPTYLLLLHLYSVYFIISECKTSISTDAMSLITIRNSLFFDKSNLISTWKKVTNSTSNHCHWYGVICDKLSGRVTSLNLTGNNLSGKLSPEIGNLTELRVLSLPYNGLNGEIPEEITTLKFLEILELQGNQFSGLIPKKLIGFSRIKRIDLSNNQFSGGIRVGDLCESLVYLNLSMNFFTQKIPSQIGNCSNLRVLILSENIFEFGIPKEIGLISQLEILDVSRNSLTDRIPKEIGKCRKLSAVILTNLVGLGNGSSSRGEEFNAFDGGVPWEILLLPELELLWAPRANLGGRLPSNWSPLCKLRILNLGQNYITGVIPEEIGLCRNLEFFDLSSNALDGSLPPELPVGCMVYFNVSRNSLSGDLPRFESSKCVSSLVACNEDTNFFEEQDIGESYICGLSSWISKQFGLFVAGDFAVAHDFSMNYFVGEVPMFSFGDGFASGNKKPVYELLLNENRFNGTLPGTLFSACEDLSSFLVNLSFNQLLGGIPGSLFLNCPQLTGFIAAHNQFTGVIPPNVGDLQKLQCLDLRKNRLSGSIPNLVGKTRVLKHILLGENNLSGEFPYQLGQLGSLTILDLSGNSLSGTIPADLANATKLKVLLLDRNRLSGEIPSSFSTLSRLSKLNVSYNQLSGHIPFFFLHRISCDSFRGNKFLEPCNSASPSVLPVPFKVPKSSRKKPNKMLLLIIPLVASATVLLIILVTVLLILATGKRKLGRFASLRMKLVVIFTEAPSDVNYDNVVRATGNFSVQHMIGTGGFGATYKAELVPGFLVAVKRLSIGRFQGVQQFEAEIRTLGRIRHKNLVTLIGYHMGESEMFLVYNYLSGGNLETFIHESRGNNAKWSVIHKISLDIAEALAYLHNSCVPRIVHRDIKPSNILLDEDLNAYLSDFGLARLLEVSETHATTDVFGTFGYVAPEYAMFSRVSDKADVYSFGVVLMELISQKRSLDPSFCNYGNGFNIVTYAQLLKNERRLSEFFSPQLWAEGPQDNLLGMLRLASFCTAEKLSVRPPMIHVVEKLKQLRYS